MGLVESFNQALIKFECGVTLALDIVFESFNQALIKFDGGITLAPRSLILACIRC